MLCSSDCVRRKNGKSQMLVFIVISAHGDSEQHSQTLWDPYFFVSRLKPLTMPSEDNKCIIFFFVRGARWLQCHHSAVRWRCSSFCFNPSPFYLPPSSPGGVTEKNQRRGKWGFHVGMLRQVFCKLARDQSVTDLLFSLI